MRHFITFVLLVFPFFLTAQTYKGLPVIQSGSRLADIRMGEEFLRQAWRIVPEASPDVLTVPCRTSDVPVAFYTDTDTIRYAVNPGDSHRFYILLQDSAYALTEIRGVPFIKPAIFTDEYIEARRGKWSVEVPEVQELLHIIFALTPTGIADSNLVEHETAYYQEVMAHFGPYREEAVVSRIDELLQKGMYADLKMNSCAFVFQGDSIVNGGTYHRLGWFDENSIEPFLPELEAFARRSGFRTYWTERLIAKGRGFLRFPEFNKKLLELYKDKPGQKIEAFYPEVLAWCRELNEGE